MIKNEDTPSKIFICGRKAERYRTTYGDGFKVEKFPFIFRIYPQYDNTLQLQINCGGLYVYNNCQPVEEDIFQAYADAVCLLEKTAAGLIEDLMSIRSSYLQVGPRVEK